MIEKQRQQAQTIDRLLQERIILLDAPLDEEAALNALAQLLFLLDHDDKAPISIYIDCPGGNVPAAFYIIDAIDTATAPIRTICVGAASGTALLVLAHGTKGSRLALPHAQFQMTKTRLAGGTHQVYGEAMRVALQRMHELVVSTLAEDCGQPQQKVNLDLKDELLLDADQAKTYGLIDAIVSAQDYKFAADLRG